MTIEAIEKSICHIVNNSSNLVVHSYYHSFKTDILFLIKYDGKE